MKYPESVLSGSALPARLYDLPEVPAALYVRGELPRGPAVAIVGTRRASAEGTAYAHLLASELARAGVAVLSGGAVGIDAAAHRGALRARGTTVVVAPSSWDRPSPEKHCLLFRRVVQRGGAHVSMVGPGTAAKRAAYFPRNGVLVALAHVVVVIEAPLKSGARNAAATARKIGRPLFVCAAPPWSSKGRGCIEELRLGARPLASARDVLRVLSEQRLHAVAVPVDRPATRAEQLMLLAPEPESGIISDHWDPEPGRRKILETLGSGSAYLDDLCVRTGLPPGRIQELLLTLRLEGVLVCDASGRVTLVNR